MKKFLQLPLQIPFWIALAFSATANAQLSATFTVQRNYSVPPNAGSYSDVTAACPAGYVALSGGLDSFGSNDLEITRLAPTFGGAMLGAQTDGTRGAADGWMASVINYGSAARVVALTAVCSPVSGVVVVIATENVSAQANGVSGFALPFVSCPAGQVALGGGVFVSRPEAMKLTASSPTFGLGNAYVYSMAPGTNTAATGWGGAINNQGQAAGTVKVAAICAALGSVVVQVSNSVVVAPSQHNGSALVCPAGHIATGGGFSAAEILPLIATVSTPLYNGYAYPAERESGEYPAPIGWFADTFSQSSTGDKSFAIGVICAPIATAPAGMLTAVYEFYNQKLKHYFRTSSSAEAIGIDNGAAGPGWVRTGDNFTAYVAAGSAPGSDVCRFYTFGANSHFYTAFAAECNSLKAPASGWVFEGLSFRILLPVASECPVGTIPVYRLYNNRFAFTDSNHRFTSVFANIAPMQTQGWLYEGVAFCALNYSPG